MLDICDDCGKDIEDFDDVGYMGGSDRTATECNPFMNFTCICKACEAKYQETMSSPPKIKQIKAMVCTRWHCPSCGDLVELEGDLRGEIRACDCGRKVRLKRDE